MLLADSDGPIADRGVMSRGVTYVQPLLVRVALPLGRGLASLGARPAFPDWAAGVFRAQWRRCARTGADRLSPRSG